MYETAFKAGPTVLSGFVVLMGHETQHVCGIKSIFVLVLL